MDREAAGACRAVARCSSDAAAVPVVSSFQRVSTVSGLLVTAFRIQVLTVSGFETGNLFYFPPPVFGGGNMSATGRASAHSSSSRTNHATRFPVSARGFGKSPAATSRLTVAVDSDKASATLGRSR
jgi:hypothetical protein